MYTAMERTALFRQITARLEASASFEGLLQIGSGAAGYEDIYSDIDLMAGCFDEAAVLTAREQLTPFFYSLGAFHVEERSWSRTALGLSAYFENGLSVDLSFLPTPELPLRSGNYHVVFSKTEGFMEILRQQDRRLPSQKGKNVDDSIHYRFLRELRYAEIALLRQEFIFADAALSRARQLLLTLEAALEQKKLHQFKAYNTLRPDFLARLDATYPSDRTCAEIEAAKKNLLSLYLDTIRQCDFLNMEPQLQKLLGCFDQARHTAFTILPYDPKYRDDMIFMVLEAKNALRRVPSLNPDLLDIPGCYLDAGDGFYLAVDEHDRVVGCGGYNSVPGTKDARLHRLYVKASKKRQGIGTALLLTIEKHLRRQGKTAALVHLGGEEYWESRFFYPKHVYVDIGDRMMRKEQL